MMIKRISIYLLIGLFLCSSIGYTIPSNTAGITDDDCSSLATWTDNDAVNGESTQTTFDSQSVFMFDTNAANTGNIAKVTKDVGSLGDRYIVTMKLYHDALGTLGDTDFVQIFMNNGAGYLNLAFATDGLFVHNGSAWGEVGTNIVAVDTWQVWTFVVNNTIASSATVEVYLDGTYQATVDCSHDSAATDGEINIVVQGTNTADLITYLDYIKVGHTSTIIWNDRTLDQEDFPDLSEWTDNDNLGGESTAVTFDSRTCLKLDSGGTPQNNTRARVTQDIGTIGSTFMMSLRIYLDALGTIANEDDFATWVNNGEMYLILSIDTTGFYLHDGASYVQIGEMVPSEDVWYKLDIIVDATTASAATCDVYINNTLMGEGLDCSYDTGITDGTAQIQHKGETTANRITYVDYFYVGDYQSTRTVSTNDESILTDTFANLDDWTDQDAVNGVSMASTFDAYSVLDQATGSANTNNRASVQQVGNSISDTARMSFRVYLDKVEERATLNCQQIYYYNEDGDGLFIMLAQEGLYLYNGEAWNLIAADLVAEDEWITYDFVPDYTTPASATTDIYINGVLAVSGADCSYEASGSDGHVQFNLLGYTIDNLQTYVDYIYVGEEANTRRIFIIS